MTTLVPITRIQDPDGDPELSQLCERRIEDIRYRAYMHFQQRGASVGNDWDDWLRAEREMHWKPAAEMFENSSAIVLRVAAPGFHPKSIQITATPHSLLLQAREAHFHDGLEARLLFCEFGQELYRLFELPRRIDQKKSPLRWTRA